HYLITTMGQSADNATDLEFYQAFCSALREEIMINWTATSNTFQKKKTRKAYYLSMEYLPGRSSRNNISNIGAADLVLLVLKKMNRDPKKILSIEPDVGIGNGGLGRLASCFMDSLATLQYPAMGYGLRYQYGIFEQELWCGVQVERPDCWLINGNPWEFRNDAHAAHVKFGGKIVPTHNSHGNEVHNLVEAEEIRALPYDLPIIGYGTDNDFSVLTLRLWSTKESPRNFQLQKYNSGEYGPAAENTSLTDVLYPNDNHDAGKRVRLKQEFLLVSSSLQDIVEQHLRTYGSIDDFADKVRIQINDTHPALAVPELMRILTKRFDYPWEKAWEVTQTVCSYTNHTILKEALEEWNEHRLEELLPRQAHIIHQINDRLIGEARTAFSGNEDKVRKVAIIDQGQMKMANLSIYGTHKTNGVAKLHSNIIKADIFPEFHSLFPDRFTNVTNGVTQRRWLYSCNPTLSKFITEKIGDGWVKNFEEIKKLSEFASDKQAQEEFLKIKQENKKTYLSHLAEKMQHSHWQGYDTKDLPLLDETALFDIQIKRIHEYKRQLMNVMHGIMLYHELKDNPDARTIKRMVLFGGKAAPGYQTAKEIIRLIYCLSRKINHEPNACTKLRYLFVENYNVSEAEIMIPAADLSEQISTSGLEASGTGNMKLSINGALTIGTEDGANIEMREGVGDAWWPFSFGASSKQNQQMHRENTYHPKTILEKHPAIKRALDALINGELAENDAEAEALAHVHETLTKTQHGGAPDKYFVLNDLPAYYEAQKKVEDLYSNEHKWAEYALNNIAGMGQFSADVSITNYANHIWGISPCPPEKEELTNVRNQYNELDRCRIL
ncbi:MAG: glycogen/starch/alpha-glucan family phosphorylase, partial [Simkaniaceae bacterium]|nr:glycogen/starch/alpha-glucan family phosphorylase [Simkaniaceae bacterium]